MQGMVPLCGFGGVPYSAVRKAAPRNLLDNSDFTNLVAQADIGGNHGTIPYAADRWILDSGTVSYEAGVGLTLNGTIRQKLEFPPTGETSAFVGMASGEASISFADGEVTIASSGGVLKWAALYSGVYTAATMPEYQPKGYGAELAECQRYFWRYWNYWKLADTGIVRSDGSPHWTINHPVSMRVAPTITIPDISLFVCQYGANSYSLKTMRGESSCDVQSEIIATIDATLSKGEAIGLIVKSAGIIDFSADL